MEVGRGLTVKERRSSRKGREMSECNGGENAYNILHTGIKLSVI